MAFNELTPTQWAVRVLLANAAVVALVGDRIDDEDNVPELKEGQDPKTYFPRLIYSGEAHADDYAGELIIGSGQFTFLVLMREDALPAGKKLKPFAVEIAGAVEDALKHTPSPQILADGRTVHGARCTDVVSPYRYGEKGKRNGIAGRTYEIIWS